MEKKKSMLKMGVSDLLCDLRKRGECIIGSKNNPNETINVWYVIAELERLLRYADESGE